ncbi:MAG: recombination protein RecR [Lachnospiraceae bacterium]|nr:recombination protein RecR [Lachnospiraceae bacterium]
MDYYGSSIGRLIESLQSLPGVGLKSAQRLAFHIIGMPKEQVKSIADSLVDARENVHFCSRCQTLTDGDLCPICASSRRDQSTIMVVENSRDLAAYERTGGYEGVYHVLQGVISPMTGVGPNDIRLKELMQRLQNADGSIPVQEVIIATSPTVEGESTAMYIVKLIRMLDLPVKITRIASGVPVGGDIENIDEVTLERALKGRTELK